jgi:hypothetical protein
MAVPYRLFYRLHLLQCRGTDPTNAYAQADKWEDVHREQSRLLSRAGTNWELWYVLYRGYVEDGWGLPGADKVMDVDTVVEYLAPYLNSLDLLPFVSFYDRSGVFWPSFWDPATATGRYYDGVNPFPSYPHQNWAYSAFNVAGHTIHAGDIPATRSVIHEAWDGWGSDAMSLHQSAEILANGMFLGIMAFTPSQVDWHAGDGLGIDLNIKNVKLRYFNACADLFTPNRGPSAGGWPLVIRGLGFANTDAEINSKSGPANAHAWGDSTYKLYIEKPDGTVVKTLGIGAPWWEFTVDSNTQITIVSMPALPPGTYQIRIHKTPDGVDTYSYAGDWRFDPDGRMTPGTRLYIWIYTTYTPPRIPIIITNWTWKKGSLTIFKHYSFIDTRAATIFWDGMLLSMSPFTRGIGGETHLPLFPDMEITADNTSREFSKLLAEYWCKNQLVEVFVGWQEEPAVFASTIFQGIVTDYNRPGSTWSVRLRDVLEKYFAIKIPKYRCTLADYPNIYKNHLGREMPEVLGLASLTTGPNPGAIEAIYVDTATYEYLGSRGSLHAVREVYSEGILKTLTTDYAISYKDGGRTYITFTADQGNNKIMFNAEGYSYADWDSANGYVQNPAYIILFLLAFFAEIPDINVDIPAFTALAAVFIALGFDEDGYLILQGGKAASDYLQELLFTYGAYHWIKGDGKITIGRKDVSNFATNLVLFQQIDALEEAKKPSGFDEAVNSAPVQWGYFPAANLFIGEKPASRPTSIAAFDTEIQPLSAWNFPWTSSEGLVDLRIAENLLRLGFGKQAINFPVSIEWRDLLDIFTNFKFQDPYGISRAGTGDVGRLAFVEKMTFDPLGMKIGIEGADLQWLLRQYCVLGDETLQPSAWTAATEEDRFYLYLCDELTGLLPDGEPGKALIDENMGG